MHALDLYMSSNEEYADVPPKRTTPATRRASSPTLEAVSDGKHRQTGDRSAMKKWIESKHRRVNDDDEDIMSIVTTGDEGEPQDDPTNSTYRAAGNRSRSRVGKLPDTESGGRKTTTPRPKARIRSQNSSNGPAHDEAGGDEVAPPPVLFAKDVKPPNAPSRTRAVRKKIVILSDSDDGDGAAGPTKKKRRIVTLQSTDSNRPAPFPMTGIERSFRESDRTLTAFVDKEAVESDGEGGQVQSGTDEGVGPDEPTVSDNDFIDDSMQCNAESITVRRTKSSSSPPKGRRRSVERTTTRVSTSRTSGDVIELTSASEDEVQRRRTSKPYKTPSPAVYIPNADHETPSRPKKSSALPREYFASRDEKAHTVAPLMASRERHVEPPVVEADLQHSAVLLQTPPPTGIDPTDDQFLDMRDLSPWERAEMWKAIASTRKRQVAQRPDGHSADIDVRPRDKGKGRATPHSTFPSRRSDTGVPLSDQPSPENDLSPEEQEDLRLALNESKRLFLERRSAGVQRAGEGSSSPSAPPPGTSAATGSYPRPAAQLDADPSTVRPPVLASPSPLVQLSVKSSAGTASALVYRKDTATVRKCLRLPEVDETLDPALHDPLLAATYAGDPNLRAGALIAWSSLSGSGHPLLSIYHKFIPSMSMQVLLDIVTFHGVNAYRNVCRISPLDVELRSAPGTGSRFNFHYSSTPPVPLIAFSTMWLERSQLVAPADTGLRQRYITGKFFAQEWQRFMGFVATASGYDELHAQLARDALQFSTRAQASLSSPAGSSSKKKKAPPASMFVQSSSSGSSRPAADQFSLGNDVAVPVYDARGAESINWEAVLPNLQGTLPPYNDGEIPEGSCVTVGYTLTVYTASSGNRTLGCNILWIIVLGCPEESDDD